MKTTKKKRNISNKGFSLIELLAVIVIVGILAVVSISAVSKYIAQSRRQKVVQNKKNVAIAAELYLQANRDLMPKMVGEVVYVPLKDLRNTNYIKEDVTNDKGEDCMKESFVRVFKLAEGDYNYTTYLYCGDEKPPEVIEPPKPYLVDFVDGEETVKVLFSEKDDVRKANFSFKLKGAANDNTIGLYSYSYSIFVKTGTNPEFTEIYNSGTIEANKNPAIEFRSRPISSYVDIPGVTAVQIKVTALNEQGGFLSYETETDKRNAGGNTEYEDTIPPVCPDFDDTSARIGEPKTLDDWIGKDAVGSTAYPRVITLKCEDGDGSGCKRETFTESWPNEDRNPLGRMFGEIIIEDNAVVDSQGNIKEPNKTTCPILVFVDLQSPSVEISPVNPAPKEGTPYYVGQDIEYKGKTYTSQPVPVQDAETPEKDNLDDITMTIHDLNYVNNFHEYDEEEGWLNDDFYPEGIEYEVTIKDNIYLYRYTWEVNEPYLNTQSPFLKETSFDNEESVIWNRVEDEELGLNEEELINNRQELTEEQNIKKFTIGFKNEGARYGVLTVYDRAGNKTIIYIYANLDRTHPPIDEHDYGVERFIIKPNVISGERIDLTEDSILGDTAGVTEGDSLGEGAKDDMYQGYDYCSDPNFKGKDMEKESGMVFDCPKTAYNTPGEVPKVCSNTNKEGYGTYFGSDEQEVEREETGCYKIGTVKGDNGIESKKYLDDSVFEELEEYKSGTWSNEELVCGPKKDMLKDNLYTKINEEGQKETVELPDEISGWVAVHMLYYKQIGVQQDVKYDEHGYPVYTDGGGYGYPDEDYKISYNYDKVHLTYMTPNFDDEEGPIDDWEEFYSNISNPSVRDQKIKLVPKYGDEIDNINVKFYNINSLDRESWPVIDDQGTHQLKWKNCDKAGNCSEYQLKENIKVDTIKPKCHNAVKYNNSMNSDGEKGPNHNGWLYNKQTATVFHYCADSSKLDIPNYFHALNSIKNSIDSLRNNDYYHYNDYIFEEFGSGCAANEKTNEEFTYKTDVYTCEAGTGGIGKYGYVEDVAGNVTACTNGVSVWKDTTPPVCGTSVKYQGINSEEEIEYQKDVPNRYGWGNTGITSIDITKSCNDSEYAKISEYAPIETVDEEGNPRELTEEEKQAYKVYSGCRRSDHTTIEDDYKNWRDVLADWAEASMRYNVNGPYFWETEYYEGYYERQNQLSAMLNNDENKTNVYVYVPDSYEGTAPLITLEANKWPNDRPFPIRVFQARNKAETIMTNQDVYGKVGAEKPQIGYECEEFEQRDETGHVVLDENGQPIMRQICTPYVNQYGGYMVDQAGNVSERECKLAKAARDSQPPKCSTKSTAMNGEFHLGENDMEWVGAIGDDGTKQYVKVWKGCNDVEVENPPGIEGVAKSYCEKIDERDPNNYWIYGDVDWEYGNLDWIEEENVEYVSTSRYTPGQRKGTEGVSFDGPEVPPYGRDIKDYAGNRGNEFCDIYSVNIDYTPPTCQVTVAEYSNISRFGDKNIDPIPTFSLVYFPRGNYTREIETTYYGTWTNQDVRAQAYCTTDSNVVDERNIASGCDYRNKDFVWNNVINEETGEREHIQSESGKVFKYNAANHVESVTLFAADVAGNVNSCSLDFDIKQDKEAPEIECHIEGSYDYDRAYLDKEEGINNNVDSRLTVIIDSMEDPHFTDFYPNEESGEEVPAFVGIHYKTNPDMDFFRERLLSWKYLGEEVRPDYYEPALGVHIGYVLRSYSTVVLDIVEGQNTYTSPIYCETQGKIGTQYYRGWVSMMDKNGNQRTVQCKAPAEVADTYYAGREVPEPKDKDYIEVPYCCVKAEGEDICGNEYWDGCSEPCGGGITSQYRYCKHEGWYNNQRKITDSNGNEVTLFCNFRQYLQSEVCNDFPCCGEGNERDYRATCNILSPYSNNPCSWGYTYEEKVSKYSFRKKCSGRNTVLCQYDSKRCSDLNQEYEQGNIPKSDSCQLIMGENVRRGEDYISLRVNDPTNCKLNSSGVVNTNSLQCSASFTDDNTLRAKVPLGQAEYGVFSKGCEIGVEWESEKYDFTNYPNLKYQSYIITKCKNREEDPIFKVGNYIPETIYCMESCKYVENAGKYYLGGKDDRYRTKCTAAKDPNGAPDNHGANDNVDERDPDGGDDGEDDYYSDKD